MADIPPPALDELDRDLEHEMRYRSRGRRIIILFAIASALLILLFAAGLRAAYQGDKRSSVGLLVASGFGVVLLLQALRRKQSVPCPRCGHPMRRLSADMPGEVARRAPPAEASRGRLVFGPQGAVYLVRTTGRIYRLRQGWRVCVGCRTRFLVDDHQLLPVGAEEARAVMELLGA